MQGFFVLATDANPSLSLPQNSRIHSNQLFYKNSESHANTLRLDVEGNGFRDAAFIRFDEKATNGIDVNYDVQKLFGLDEAPQLFFTASDEKLSINALPKLEESIVINMEFECGQAGLFTLYASDIENSFPDTKVILEDVKENIFQNLNINSSYSYSYQPGENSDRFRLHFNYSNLGDSKTENDINIRFYDNLIWVNTQCETTAILRVFNLQGQEVIPGFGFTENAKVSTIGLHGFFLVQVITDKSTKSEKIFIK